MFTHCDEIEEYEKTIDDFKDRELVFTINYYEGENIEPQLEVKEYVELIAGYLPRLFIVPHHTGDFGLSVQLMKEFIEELEKKNVMNKYKKKPVVICPLEGSNVVEYATMRRLYGGVNLNKVYGLSDGTPLMNLPMRNTIIDYIMGSVPFAKHDIYHLMGFTIMPLHKNIVSINSTFPFSMVLMYTEFKDMNYWDIDFDKVEFAIRDSIRHQAEVFALYHNGIRNVTETVK